MGKTMRNGPVEGLGPVPRVTRYKEGQMPEAAFGYTKARRPINEDVRTNEGALKGQFDEAASRGSRK